MNRFSLLSKRFMAELLATKEESKQEMILKRIKIFTFKLYPVEEFEDGLVFMNELSSAFGNAHGRMKTLYIETLSAILEPLLPIIQAEANIPGW